MAKQYKVLVIDDDFRIQKQTYQYLVNGNFSVELAADATDGIRLAHKHQPDLIVCDLVLPNGSGYDILHHIREDEALALIPIIVISADVSDSTRRASMEQGASDFLHKPIVENEFLMAVYSQIRHHQRFSNAQNTQKEQLERAKKQLSMMVAHELRTPLMTVTMSRDLMWMQLDDPEPDPASMRDMLMMMSKGTQRLKHLVEQMVLLTQVETGILSEENIQNHFYEIQLHELLNDAVRLSRQFNYYPIENPINIQKDGQPITLSCNIQSLKHAIAEIVDNAAQFSPDTEPIYITYEIHGNLLWLSIIDQGPGIPTKAIKYALQEFEQVDREKQEQQGVGMGLPLAYRIVDAHGGSLDIRPLPQGGTQVILNLPIVIPNIVDDAPRSSSWED